MNGYRNIRKYIMDVTITVEQQQEKKEQSLEKKKERDCEQCSQKKTPPQNHDPGKRDYTTSGASY